MDKNLRIRHLLYLLKTRKLTLKVESYDFINSLKNIINSKKSDKGSFLAKAVKVTPFILKTSIYTQKFTKNMNFLIFS